MAARLIAGLRKYDRITETMYDLHWLPVERRIQFKLLLVTYKALNGLAPVYLSSLLVPYSSRRSNMQPHGNFLLQVPCTSKATFGDRTNTAVAPVLWNELPSTIKQSCTVESYKEQLKTHLFRLEYY